MEKQFTIGEESRRFLEALDALKAFESCFMDALTAQYGEKTGLKFWQERHADKCIEIEQAIMEYLRIQFTWEMGMNKAQISI